MIYLDVISKINAESKHASGLDLSCLAGKAEEVRSRKSEVGSRKSEVALLGHRNIAQIRVRQQSFWAFLAEFFCARNAVIELQKYQNPLGENRRPPYFFTNQKRDYGSALNSRCFVING
jgi:hypothetical protein